MKLIFKEHDTKFVSEVFGMSSKAFAMMCESMEKYFDQTSKADNKPMDSKTLLLDEYIKSDEFKEMNFPLKSANDFFLLGYIFNNVLEKRKGEGIGSLLHALSHAASVSHDGNTRDESEEGGGRLPN